MSPTLQHRAVGLPAHLLDPVVARLERMRCQDLPAHLVCLPLVVLPIGSSCKHGAPRRRLHMHIGNLCSSACDDACVIAPTGWYAVLLGVGAGPFAVGTGNIVVAGLWAYVLGRRTVLWPQARAHAAEARAERIRCRDEAPGD